MPCYNPIQGYRASSGAVFFHEQKRHGETTEIKIACGQCIGCKKTKARDNAIRITHEQQLHLESCFLTLTYDNEHLPRDLSLYYPHFQRFMRDLRKKHKVRFYMCGEYGEITGRPHYHAAIFGYGFNEDKYKWSISNGHQLYRSKELEKLWKHGNSTIGALTYDSAQYVAKYIIKKKNGDGEKDYYNILDVTTGEIVPRRKEFSKQSLKPGIAKEWLQLYWPEIQGGTVLLNGKESAIPKYYRRYLKNTERFTDIIDKLQGEIRPEDTTEKRLKEREQYDTITAQLKKRNEE